MKTLDPGYFAPKQFSKMFMHVFVSTFVGSFLLLALVLTTQDVFLGVVYYLVKPASLRYNEFYIRSVYVVYLGNTGNT